MKETNVEMMNMNRKAVDINTSVDKQRTIILQVITGVIPLRQRKRKRRITITENHKKRRTKETIEKKKKKPQTMKEREKKRQKHST